MTGTDKPTPNERLRQERERLCWSQSELADKVGTTPLNISRWERGVTLPGPHFRQKLCEVFGKNAQELGLVTKRGDEGIPVEPAHTQGAVVASPLLETPASLWNVPYGRNLFFTGREDILTHLRSTLTLEEQPVALTQPQAISGLGGIGKTQTAVEYAHRYRDSYNAVFWARADSSDVLVSDLLLIGSLLNLPQRNERDQSVVVNAVMHWFDSHERWLLILDNADHLEKVSQFIPSAGKGHILLTTRAQATGTVAQRIEINKMDFDEGILFLLRRAKRIRGTATLETVPAATSAQAQAIIEVVDGLPLALDQAGAYIEETGCSLTDYLKYYKTRRTRMLRTRGRDATGHPEPVATTWSLSFEKVEQANPAAAELLRLCAFLHPDSIPEAMIVEGASELGPILQAITGDELELNEAIGELLKYSLVRRDAEMKLLNIHRLVQAVLKDGMDEQTYRRWIERTVRTVDAAFPKVEFANWPRCEQYLPHAQTCATLIGQSGLTFPEGAYLLYKSGDYLAERGRYTEAERLLQQALGIFERQLGPQHPDTAKSLNTLGILYAYQGKYVEAEPLFQRALAIRERQLGAEHPDTAKSLNGLANIYVEQGKYAEAEPLFQRTLMIRERQLGPEHPDTAKSLNGLASIYAYQGKYAEAEPLFQRALVIWERQLGAEHPNTAKGLHNLGELYGLLGKYAEAEPPLQRALVIRERQLGPQHPDTAQSLNSVAALYRLQGKYTEAEPLHQRALAIRAQQLGPEHPDTVYSLYNLAELYRLQGKYTEAEPLYKRVLAIWEQQLEAEHPWIVEAVENYAHLLRTLHRENEAIQLEARVKPASQRS